MRCGPRYLVAAGRSRFNRLHLAFGLGYDTLQQVADSYCLFLYPFLVDVPGYPVRVTNLTDAERDQNLTMLRFISEQAVARGLVFQLGVWMHGYQLSNSPQARHVVEGLTADTHAPYCRDALTAVLRACPAISRRRAANPRRERHQGRQLRLLADGVRWCRAMRTCGRNRPSCQGARPADDRARASRPACP